MSDGLLSTETVSSEEHLRIVAADAQLVGYRSPAQNALLKGADEIKQLRADLADARSGLRYILVTHGRLSGVGWDRILPEVPSER